MTPLPMTGAVAECRGIRYRILFANSDWLALRVNSDACIARFYDVALAGMKERYRS